MYILSYDKKALGKYRTIRIERNLGGKKQEKYLIYGCAQDSMPVTLAKFPTEEAAKDELLNIAAAMQNGNAVYAMPEGSEGEL